VRNELAEVGIRCSDRPTGTSGDIGDDCRAVVVDTPKAILFYPFAAGLGDPLDHD